MVKIEYTVNVDRSICLLLPKIFKVLGLDDKVMLVIHLSTYVFCGIVFNKC